MGCCGCSLYGSTVTAGILTLLDCVLYLTFDVLVILFLSVKDHWKTEDHPDFNKFVAGFREVQDSTTIIILIGIKVGLRIVWLISAVLLLVGNAREFRKFINVWKYLTISRIVYTIGTSIYALVSMVGDIKVLFEDNHKWKDNYTSVSYFVILMDFLELGPIWLIILIALVIYVHQRGQEIELKKNQPNHWGNFSQSNGGARNGQVHPVSLTREPNPFTITAVPDNNNTVPNNNNFEPTVMAKPANTMVGPMPGTSPIPGGPSAPKHDRNEPLKPILDINGVISIPRVTLSLTKPTQFDSRHENKRYVSSLANRRSYFEVERDAQNVPKRNNSYHIAQNTGKKPYAYENRAFDSKTEADIYKPVLIKRASTRRSQK